MCDDLGDQGWGGECSQENTILLSAIKDNEDRHSVHTEQTLYRTVLPPILTLSDALHILSSDFFFNKLQEFKN